MKNIRLRLRSHLLAALAGIASVQIAAAATPSKLDDPVEGQKLARQVRSLMPNEAAEFGGILRLSRPGTPPYDVPVTNKLIVGTDSWTAEYLAHPPRGPEERLEIKRVADRPNEYIWKREKVLTLSGVDATNQFAGSDFALMDLGMEFLHWPHQMLLTREMRKGRGCDVLESRPDRPGLYARIVSWIDQETSGLLIAEAYDARGKLLKEFEVKGFKKVDGQWRVREMEIRNRQSKTSTRLQFEFD
jgi:hypothetical protein